MKLNLLVAASFLLVVPTAVFSQPRTGESAPLAPESVEPSAAYQTARDLLKAKQSEESLRKGFQMMLAAAEKGHLQAIAGVAYLYNVGMGTPKDNTVAAKWFRLAAEKEHAISQYNLGKLLGADQVPLPEGIADREAQHGEGVEWLRKAADQGLHDAQEAYGVILYRGDFGVKPDAAAAAGYLKPAAEAGKLEAINALGLMHKIGAGVPYDLAESERLLRKAAMRGHVKAQANLGEHLNPNSKDHARRTESLAWLFIAEEAKDIVAKKILALQLQITSPDDIEAAKDKASEIKETLEKGK